MCGGEEGREGGRERGTWRRRKEEEGGRGERYGMCQKIVPISLALHGIKTV